MPDNPNPPVHPDRLNEANLAATQELIKLVQSLQRTLIGQSTSDPQTRVHANQMALDIRGGVSDVGMSQWAAQSQLGNYRGAPSSGASMPELASASEIGPIEALKGGFAAWRERKPFVEGALNRPARHTNIPGYRPGQISEGASMAQDDVDRMRDQETWQRGPGPGASLPPNTFGGGIAGGFGGGGGGRSPIPGVGPQRFGEMQNDPIKIPQFGEWQLDTNLRLMSDVFGKMAGKRGQYDENGNWQWNEGQARTGKLFAKGAGVANYGYSHAAEIQVARNAYKKIAAYGGGLVGAGAALGYSPQTGLGPSHVLGMENPLSWFSSEAGRQGGGMNLDALSMARFGTGLSLDQSRAIYSNLAGMGFSNQRSGFLGMTTGGDLQNIAKGLVAPMVKEGASPELAVQFAEQLKSGTVSIKGLSDALKNLNDYAKATHQTLNQAGESILQYGQAATGAGASPIQGYIAAKAYTSASGQSAANAAPLLGNSFFQAQVMAKYGILPENIGTLPGELVAKTELTTIEKLKGLYAAHNIVDPATGEIISSADEQKNAFAAHQLGVSREQVEQTLHSKGKLPVQAKLATEIGVGGNWNRAWRSMQGRSKTRDVEKEKRQAAKEWGVYDSNPLNTISRDQPKLPRPQKIQEEYNKGEGKYDRHGGWYATLSAHNQHILMEGGNWEESPGVVRKIPGMNKEVAQQLKEAGASSKEVQDFQHASLQDKHDKAEKILSRRSKANISTQGGGEVVVGLTPEAAKALKIEGGPSAAERSAYAGGPSTASRSVEPQTPSR